jgi:hypothetical protein
VNAAQNRSQLLSMDEMNSYTYSDPLSRRRDNA